MFIYLLALTKIGQNLYAEVGRKHTVHPILDFQCRGNSWSPWWKRGILLPMWCKRPPPPLRVSMLRQGTAKISQHSPKRHSFIRTP